MAIVGWLLWGMLALWSISSLSVIFYEQIYGGSGLDRVIELRIPSISTFIWGVIGTLLAVLFLIYNFNKFHLLWAAPVSYLIHLTICFFAYRKGFFRVV